MNLRTLEQVLLTSDGRERPKSARTSVWFFDPGFSVRRKFLAYKAPRVYTYWRVTLKREALTAISLWI